MKLGLKNRSLVRHIVQRLHDEALELHALFRGHNLHPWHAVVVRSSLWIQRNDVRFRRNDRNVDASIFCDLASISNSAISA